MVAKTKSNAVKESEKVSVLSQTAVLNQKRGE